MSEKSLTTWKLHLVRALLRYGISQDLRSTIRNMSVDDPFVVKHDGVYYQVITTDLEVGFERNTFPEWGLRHSPSISVQNTRYGNVDRLLVQETAS